MNLKNSKIALRHLEYIAVFLGFFLMYWFIVPQSDVFLFAHATDADFASVLEYSLYYGNGRLLGNIIGIYFSHHFAFSVFIISLTLTLIVASLNDIIWDNHVSTVFPTALLVAFPSPGMLEECYYLFAAFCNYVIPIAFILISIRNLKYIICNSSVSTAKQYLHLFLSLLCAACSCLFSENTTVLIVVVSVLFVVFWYLYKKRLSPYLLLYAMAVLAGTLIMYLIPILTDTGVKMDDYRHIAGTPFDLLRQCAISFLKFSDVFNQMYLPVCLLSLAMFLLCLKQQRFRSSLKKIQLAVFAIYPFLVVGLSMIDSHSLISYTTLYHTVDALLVILFVMNVLVTILLTEDKAVRLLLWFFAIIAISSVAPMMVVNQSGYRTYYTTFICVTVMALWLLRQHSAEYLQNNSKKTELRRCVSTAAASCFLVLTLALLCQSVGNYDFYVIRSNYIAEKITLKEDYYVPCMPYETLSVEDSWITIIHFPFPPSEDSTQTTVELSAWEMLDYYKDTVLNDPVHALSFAIENWEYKNPLYPASLCS